MTAKIAAARKMMLNTPRMVVLIVNRYPYNICQSDCTYMTEHTLHKEHR